MDNNFVPAFGSNTMYKKASELKVGEAFIAYVTGAVESKMYPGKFDLECYTSDKQEKFVISTAGNLKYFAKDVFDGKQPKGCLMKITRKETKMNKRNQAVSQFEVAIDKSKQFEPTTNEDIKF